MIRKKVAYTIYETFKSNFINAISRVNDRRPRAIKQVLFYIGYRSIKHIKKQ